MSARRFSLSPLRDSRHKLRRGRFLVLEGIDGAGTTTQAVALDHLLGARGERTLLTCEPSNGPLGMLLRQALVGRLRGRQGPMDPACIALLFAADRIDHVSEEILPALESGITVVCDRYVLSSIAYQGLSLDPSEVAAMNARAPAPDLTLFLDVPPAVAQRRREATRTHDELFDALKLQRRIDRNYRRAMATGIGGPVTPIDGMRAIDAVTAEIVEAIDAL